MKKAQSLIVQFILFFLIGFSIFLVVGNLFRTQSEILKADISSASRKLISKYISSVAIASYDSCKQCDFVNFSIILPKKVADNYIETILDSSGLAVSTVPENQFYNSSIHNLNASLTMIGKASSAQPITLTLYKTQNNLEVK